MKKWGQRLLISFIYLVLLCGAAAAVDEEYLEQKALEYDEWFQQWCSLGYGGATEVLFADDDLTVVQALGGRGDSTIWTGTYLVGEAYRYAVTGDEQAKQNAIKAVMTLHTHLKVTNTNGYIARYAGPDEPPFNTGYVGGHNYHQGVGDYADAFWTAETSRDQYTGWMMGMAVAYDMIDDEQIRDLIREDIVEVVDKARFYYWFIMKETGTPSTVAAQIVPSMQIDWSLIEAHVTDDPMYWQLYEEKFDDLMSILPIDAQIGFFNRYYEHYGLNLSHETWFNILRLERDPNRRAYLMDVFDKYVRPTVQGAHNVWYDYIYLANFGNQATDYEWTVEDDLSQLEKFPEPPKRSLLPESMPACELDPLGEWLIELVHKYGLEEILHFGSSCAEAREIENRCPTDFVWQRNSWEIECGGSSNPREISPGIDYISPYWMGRYYNLVPPGNPAADDDDDDLAPDEDDAPDRDNDADGGPGGYDPADESDDDQGCCGD